MNVGLISQGFREPESQAVSEKFFDRVHHDTHPSMVKRKVADRKVLSPIAE
jgi:hypothetical protein